MSNEVGSEIKEPSNDGQIEMKQFVKEAFATLKFQEQFNDMAKRAYDAAVRRGKYDGYTKENAWIRCYHDIRIELEEMREAETDEERVRELFDVLIATISHAIALKLNAAAGAMDTIANNEVRED